MTIKRKTGRWRSNLVCQHWTASNYGRVSGLMECADNIFGRTLSATPEYWLLSVTNTFRSAALYNANGADPDAIIIFKRASLKGAFVCIVTKLPSYYSHMQGKVSIYRLLFVGFVLFVCLYGYEFLRRR